VNWLRTFTILAASASLAGCGALLGVEDLTVQSDASVDGTVAPEDGGAARDAFTMDEALAEGGTGSGQNGSLQVSSDMVVNAYASVVVSTSPGARSLTVDDATPFAANDAVLVWQTTGLPSATSGDSATMDLTPTGVGHFEVARVASTTGSTLMLMALLGAAYPASVSQVVRVPEYTDVTIAAGGAIHATPWDGTKGGMVALMLTGALHNEGKIYVDGAGFRGGRGWLTPTTVTSGGGACEALDGTPATGYALKGEGLYVAGYTNVNDGTGSGGRGNLANGGGGGNCSNAGGAGGGHGGAGGGGGETWTNTGNAPVGGYGGAALGYDPLTRLVFGGAGGAGDSDAPFNGITTNGGAGGGVVFVRTGSVDGAGTISANGGSGAPITSNGGAGGGAGGLIVIDALATVSCSQSYVANGGNGSNVTAGWGPGGGGGGGRVLVRATSVTCALAAGAGNPGGPEAHGATPGAAGTTQTLMP
jgi:hypothetical protein